MAVDPDLIYFNGIDPETGTYAFPPMSVDDLAKLVLARPGVKEITQTRGEVAKPFGLPYGLALDNLEDVGWGIVSHEDTAADVRAALAPLIEARHKQAGDRFKELDYKKDEQIRDWYHRHKAPSGSIDPEILPYYLLLVGPPNLIPFEFQYLLGVDYAVGRLDFDTASDYSQYVSSILDFESADTVPNKREIAYWGTRHPGDPATNLSASLLIDPLANGLPGAAGVLRRPVHEDARYSRTLCIGEDATKERLLSALHAAAPPAILFTASHGMAIRAGRSNQLTDQGALICQDWPSFTGVRPEHMLSAKDVTDDANVHGLVAFIFACFGGGTPELDQFPSELSKASTAPHLAPQPFVSALPRRLLVHPKGSALAVIAHVDRAWGYSIQEPKTTGSQIEPFRNTLDFILKGAPVGHAVTQQFGGRFAALSAILLNAVAPTLPPEMRLSDRDLVTYWIERNDAQNYVVLGDPAVRIREAVLA